MKFTTFVIVASFFSLVVAIPAIDKVDEVEKSESDCTGQFCYNARTGITQACCVGSYCDLTVGIGYYYCA